MIDDVLHDNPLQYLAAVACEANGPIISRFNLASLLKYWSDDGLLPFLMYFTSVSRLSEKNSQWPGQCFCTWF